jgi:uncharacterized HAD superfamily protein
MNIIHVMDNQHAHLHRTLPCTSSHFGLMFEQQETWLYPHLQLSRQLAQASSALHMAGTPFKSFVTA